MAKYLWYGPTSFGNVSIGDLAARIPVTVSREDLSLTQADELLVGKRIDVKVVLGSKKGDDQQGKLIETDVAFTGSADIKSLSVKMEFISFGLTFVKNSVELDVLSKFAKCKGKLYITASAHIPEGQEIPDEEDEEEGDAAMAVPTLPEKSWKRTPIERVFPGAIVHCCHQTGITTLGQLCAYFIAGKTWTDIPGIGASKAQAAEQVFQDLVEHEPHSYIRETMAPVAADAE